MVHINHQQNNFSAGVVQPQYLGRADLNLYANGVKAMHNMDILPSGALQKRQGTKNIKRIKTTSIDTKFQARIENFTSHDDRDFIILFTDSNLDVFEIKQEDINHLGRIAGVQPYIRKLSGTTTGWKNEAQLQSPFWLNHNMHEFKIAKGENYFMICHKKNQPLLLLYSPSSEQQQTETQTKRPPFALRPWITNMTTSGHYQMPYSRFNADKSTELKLQIDDEGYYLLRSKTDFFNKDWKGANVRIADNGYKELEVISYVNSTMLVCRLVGVTGSTSVTNKYTNDWSESIFSDARGWPACATFHQGRLIFAGSESFPKTIWMSKSGDYHNFSLGENSDDAIDVTLAYSEAGEIRHLLSAKHLQIFTASSEWVITDEVITPSQITAQKRTNIGIHERGTLAPLLLNGSSLFFDNENNLHEYTYANLEDSYVVNNISRLTDTAADMPLNMVYDSHSRRLFCPWGNGDSRNNSLGNMKILNLYTAEKITAWSEYKTTGGTFIDTATIKGKIFALSLRYFEYQGTEYLSCYLEQFMDSAKRDCLTLIDKTDSQASVESALQEKGRILLDTETQEIGSYYFHYLTYSTTQKYDGVLPLNKAYLDNQLRWKGISRNTPVLAGLGIEAYIESLPPIFISNESHSRYRILEAVYHVGKNDEFAVGINSELRAFHPHRNSVFDNNTARSVKVFGSGWSNDLSSQIWKIHFTNRSDFTLYGAEMRLSVH